MVSDGTLQTVVKHDGLYCTIKQKEKKAIKVPLTTQPDDDKVIIMRRYYSTLQACEQYKRRITWLEKAPQASKTAQSFAIAEYTGSLPTKQPHGNAKTTTAPYIRTSQVVLDKIDEKLHARQKPRQAYYALKKENEYGVQPRDLKQIQNRQAAVKKQEREKRLSTDTLHNSNMADQIQTLMSMATADHEFVRAVLQLPDRPPA